MWVGVPKEIKNHEYRVGLTPAGVRELKQHGAHILIEQGAGEAVGFSDAHYQAAGAEIGAHASEIFSRADIIVKVKEPQPHECALLRPGKVLFTFLHLAPDAQQTAALLQSGCVAIAYETVTDAQGGLPLLAPMSEVAGRMAIQAAARVLEKTQHGPGLLLGGVPGVAPAHVTIIGGGVVGLNAARLAMGMGAEVTLLDRNLSRLQQIDLQFGGRIKTLYSTQEAIEQELRIADVIVGAVLIPGAATPKLINREMLAMMKSQAVLVDVAIDQGGCFATSRATTHQQPTYVLDDVIHYCVTNIPGAVARTSTLALTNATLRFIVAMLKYGWRRALSEDKHLSAGLNICNGHITHPAVAEALGYTYVSASTLLTS